VKGDRAPSREAVRDALLRLFIDAEGARLRREDEQKAAEVGALLIELGRFRRDGLLVDAAAGKSPVGLVAAELLGFSRLVVIERDADRAGACREAASRLRAPAEVDVREGDVGDPALWPERPDVAVALHACGPAADRIIDAAVRARARSLLLVPCCYGMDVPFAGAAREAIAEAGLPRQGELRRRMENSLVDAERTLRLEAGGYDVEVVAFVAPTVTPHNLLWRARWAGEPRAMARAAAKRDGLLRACIPPRG
jgi:hypothetical protein